MEIDAIDNGVNVADVMRYGYHTHLASRVARLNLDWDAPDTADIHGQFRKAMKIGEEEFMYQLKSVQSTLKAQGFVQESFNKREQVHPSGEVMVLE